MLRVAFKGVMARKLRLLLTSVAVVLGVGFVAGAFFLTDSMRDSFDSLFTEASEGIDVHIQSTEYKKLIEQQATATPGTISIDLARVGMPPSVIEEVEDLEGVEQVAGSIFEIGATVLDKQGKPMSSGAPAFGANWVPGAEDIGALRIVEGEAPEPDQVLLDASVMEDGKFEIGDDVRVLTQGGRQVEEFEVSGVVKFGESNNLNGATITVFETARAQELFDMGDRYTAVEVKAEEGVSQAALKRSVLRAIGGEYDVITGQEFTNEQTEAIDNSFLSLLQNVILGFAAVAVFVGAFTIFNTFTILVGQRTREIGLLRAIGAGRGQVLGIVVLEALVTGVVASTLGIVAGYGIATALREILEAVGFELPGSEFPLRTRTIVVSYVVGVVVTLVASIIPAIRASRLSPLEALRANSAHAGRGWKAPTAGTILLLIGSGLVFSGFTAEDASVSETLSLIGGGFAVAIIGIALLSRIFILPVTRVLSLPFVQQGSTGRIATGNVLRNRARSATTSSALMIGLALAALVLVFQASLEKTVDAEIDRTLGSDITVYNSTALTSGTGYVDQDDLDAIAQVEGVDTVASQYYGGASIGSDAFDGEDTKTITAFDEPALEEGGAINLQVSEGATQPGDGVLVDEDIAKDEGWKVGDSATFAFSTAQEREFEIVGIYEPNEFVGAPAIISKGSFDELQPPAVQAAAFSYVTVVEGANASKVSARITKELGTEGAYLEVQDTQELRDTFREQLAPILGLVFGMLSLSLIIALFGIGNTLALNVFERTREIGLLRAVGGTRWQLRWMIVIESVLVAVFGAIVGVLVGLVAGWALVSALRDEGFEFAVSGSTIVIILVAGIIAGVLAAVFPARRAARTDVLEAIATE